MVVCAYMVKQETSSRTKLSQKWNNRLTFVLCVNATGTSKVSLLLIGWAVASVTGVHRVHTFNKSELGWIGLLIASSFFYVFLPCIRQTTTDKVALLMDNCAGHDSTIVDPTWQVTVFFPSKLYTSSPATRSRHHFIFQDFVKDGSRDGTHRILHKSQCKRS